MRHASFQSALRAFARREPFKPFTVQLVSGDHFVVDHPEALALRASVAVFIDSAGGYALFDNTGVAQLCESTDDGRRIKRRRGSAGG